MKLLVVILILLNIAVFAWLQWGQDEPEAIPTEYHPERIRLADNPPPATTSHAKQSAAALQPQPQPQQTSAPAAPQPSAAPAHPTPARPATPAQSQQDTGSVKPTDSTTNPQNATPDQLAAAAAAQNTPAAPVCMAWGPVDAAHTAAAQTQLNQLHLGERLHAESPASASGPFWVFYPPLPDKQAADAKLAALQQLGVKDISVVRTGSWKNALSMGLYGQADMARLRLAKLDKLGVHVQIEAYGKAPRNFLLLDLTPAEQSAAQAIGRAIAAPGMQPVPCPATDDRSAKHHA